MVFRSSRGCRRLEDAVSSWSSVIGCAPITARRWHIERRVPGGMVDN